MIGEPVSKSPFTRDTLTFIVRTVKAGATGIKVKVEPPLLDEIEAKRPPDERNGVLKSCARPVVRPLAS